MFAHGFEHQIMLKIPQSRHPPTPFSSFAPSELCNKTCALQLTPKYPPTPFSSFAPSELCNKTCVLQLTLKYPFSLFYRSARHSLQSTPHTPFLSSLVLQSILPIRRSHSFSLFSCTPSILCN